MSKQGRIAYKDLSKTAQNHAHRQIIEWLDYIIDDLKHKQYSRKEMDETMAMRNHPEFSLENFHFTKAGDVIELIEFFLLLDILGEPRH